MEKNKKLDELIKKEDELDLKWESGEVSDEDYLKGRKELLMQAKRVLHPALVEKTDKCKNIETTTKQFIGYCLRFCNEFPECTDRYQKVRLLDNTPNA